MAVASLGYYRYDSVGKTMVPLWFPCRGAAFMQRVSFGDFLMEGIAPLVRGVWRVRTIGKLRSETRNTRVVLVSLCSRRETELTSFLKWMVRDAPSLLGFSKWSFLQRPELNFGIQETLLHFLSCSHPNSCPEEKQQLEVFLHPLDMEDKKGILLLSLFREERVQLKVYWRKNGKLCFWMVCTVHTVILIQNKMPLLWHAGCCYHGPHTQICDIEGKLAFSSPGEIPANGSR